jgi:cellulose synthase/poly-beta-1,6-N-acetylglucosamine synthase-like glycosyltransferase
MTTALCITVLLLLLASGPCLWYFVLYLAGCIRTSPTPADPLPLCVLIPAHDEAAGLPRTLQSLADADYPPELLRVLVVADNCTDDTSAVATRHKAEVLTRTDTANRGKGYALAFGLPHAVAGVEGVIVVDADCTVNRHFLRRMCDALRRGEAVQAAVQSDGAGRSPAGYVAAVGSAIDSATGAGAGALGLSVPLRGTGMGFRPALLNRVPWGGFGRTEDAEYAATLHAAGVKVSAAHGAEVRCDPPHTGEAFAVQRARWSAALRFNPLKSKPLVLLHLLLTTAAVLLLAGPLAVGWLALLWVFTATVYISAAAPLGVPPLAVVGVVAKLVAVAVRGFRKGGEWLRTPR